MGGEGKLTTRTGEEVDLELYKSDSCPYCQRVFMALDRLGVQVRMADTRRDEKAARRLQFTGGKQQVPCLFIDGKPLYESGDIVAWLEEQFGDPAPSA
jgi:glutathione S-transferase